MANANLGEAALVVAGSVYTLSFSLNAICEVEDASGERLEALVEKMQASHFPSVRLVLWGALIDNHPDVDLKTAGKLLPDGGVIELVRILSLAIQRSFPSQEKGDPPAKPKQGGTGEAS